MKGKVTCTCGWSWNKSDSSKKDMYICHECGRDNSNNMKNGGWLDNIPNAQGGTEVDWDKVRNVNDNVAVQTAKFFDPTGFTSWPDVYYAIDDYKKGKGSGLNVALNILGALPVLGKLGRAAGTLSRSQKLAKATEKIVKVNKVLDKVEKVVPNVAKAIGRTSDIIAKGSRAGKANPVAVASKIVGKVAKGVEKADTATRKFTGKVLDKIPGTEGDVGNIVNSVTSLLNIGNIASDTKSIIDASSKTPESNPSIDKTKTIKYYNTDPKRGEVEKPGELADVQYVPISNSIQLKKWKEQKGKLENGGWLDQYADGGTMQEHQENYNDYKVSAPEGMVGDGYSNVGRNYSPAWGGQFQGGGSIPGTPGFTYARTNDPAPSEGPYAKKTKASAQNGYVTGDKVEYGTPEYTEAYNKGEVVTDEGVRSPIALDEVVIQNNYRRPRGFWEQYADKIVEENKDAGLLGAIIGTPISAITSLPQLAATYGITGEMQRPSEAMDIENPYGAFAVDAVADPTNWVGVGELTALGRLNKAKALAKLKNIPTSAAPKLRQSLNTAGFSLNDLNPFKFKPKSNRLYSELNDKNAVEEFLGKSNITNAQKKIWNNSPSMKSKYLLEADPRNEVFSNGLSTYDIPLDHLQGSNIYKKNWLGNYKRIEPVDYFGFTRNGEDLNPFIEPQKVQYSDFIHPEQAADLAHQTRNDYENLFGMSMPESPARSNDLYPDVSNNWMTDAIERNAMKDHFYQKSMMPESWEGFYDKFRGNYDWDVKHFPERKAEFDLNFTDITPEEKAHLFDNIQKQKDGGIIKDDRGQWEHPGEITEINSPYITMQGVPYDVLGISDTGDTKLMKPGKDYKFKGKKVTEYPMAKNGLRQEQKGLVNLDNLLNFTNYNTKQPGGWLDNL